MEDKHLEAEKDYISGMKYKDIAEKYGVTLNTVKSWKQRYEWTKGVHTKSKKVCTQKSKKKESEYDQIEETFSNDELTEKELYFCAFYVQSWNATQSYIKAYGCKYETAMVEGCKSLRKPKIKKEIERLKEIKRQQLMCDKEDILFMHQKIAHANIGDYLTFGTKMEDVMGPFGPIQVENPKTGQKETIQREVNFVKLFDSEYTDTSLIQEIKQVKGGVSVKLVDKQKSIEFLQKYFEKESPTDTNANIMALADILLQSRENRSIEDFEEELKELREQGEAQDESDSTL